jgi:MFS family permease
MDDKVSVSQTGHRQDESKAVQEDHLERYSAFTERQKLCIIFLVAFAGWFSTLSSFIYFPAITPLADDLGTTVDKINLSITSYMIVSGLAPSIIGDLADMMGRRPVYIATLTLYFSANIALAVQKSFPALLILRMLQSAGISGKPRAFSVHPVETA